MPKLTDIQKNAIDIIDIIHFFNIYSGHNIFSTSRSLKKEKEINHIFFHQLISLIDRSLEKNNIPQKQLIYFKHYLLCGIEINLNQIDYDKAEAEHPSLPKRPTEISPETFLKVEQHNKNFFTALISQLLKNKSIDFDLYKSILYEIIESLKESNFPSSFYFRINLRTLAFEYPLASIYVYKKFLDYGILHNSRYTYEDKNKELSTTIFLRSLLSIEFELFRDFSKFYLQSTLNDDDFIDFYKFNFIEKSSFPSEAHKESTIKYYKKDFERNLDFYYLNKKPAFYCLGDISCKEDIISLLKFMSKNYIHHNFFSSKQSNLIGALGSQLIFNSLYTSPDKRAIYCEYKSKNGLTWSEIASNSLKDIGFTAYPRTLYLHYKDLKKLKYEQIRLFEIIIDISYGYNWNTSFHELFLFAYKYDPNIN